jgi:hypothetical protein
LKSYRLLGADGKEYISTIPGTFGGHRGQRIYGRLDCKSALQTIAKGKYIKHRVFFASEVDAIAAGYRPCGKCLKELYLIWKKDNLANLKK